MKDLIVAVLAMAAGVAQAQHGGYAGHESRDIKALSPQEIEQYRSGAGMGYAKAAELNRFPGPMHVLELADPLGLTDEQRNATRRLMDQHKHEARLIGAKVIDAERTLEALFRKGTPDEAALSHAVREAAALQGQYRLSHLETHRRMRALLTEEQVKRYDALRGYSAPHLEHKPGH
jgi:Spy/CpxP family protein refolding chaperone